MIGATGKPDALETLIELRDSALANQPPDSEIPQKLKTDLHEAGYLYYQRRKSLESSAAPSSDALVPVSSLGGCVQDSMQAYLQWAKSPEAKEWNRLISSRDPAKPGTAHKQKPR
jgi:hypothetical protein